MGLDTKYRPVRYADVVGQTATVTILRRIIQSGAGFSQSYLFGGPWGSGKTTLARILAKTLLCHTPQEGEACGKCRSCEEMQDGISPDFREVDAATHSGKADVVRLLENIPFDEHAGRRQLYLFDESHAFSSEAEDAMLKFMEEDRPDRPGQKRLVNIFCTTEPDNVRPTILSRCAPAFRIRIPSVAEIVGRLRFVCDQEQIQFEEAGLSLIATATGGHFRDALKALEAVSTLGPVTRDLVATHVGSDLDELFVQILQALSEPSRLGPLLDLLLEKVSPSTAYRQLSEFALAAFQVSLGIQIDTMWRPELLGQAGQVGLPLLHLADRMGSRPTTVSKATLLCDLLFGLISQPVHSPAGGITLPARPGPWSPPATSQNKLVGGVYLESVAMKGRANPEADPKPKPPTVKPPQDLSVPAFQDFVLKRLDELSR